MNRIRILLKPKSIPKAPFQDLIFKFSPTDVDTKYVNNLTAPHQILEINPRYNSFDYFTVIVNILIGKSKNSVESKMTRAKSDN